MATTTTTTGSSTLGTRTTTFAKWLPGQAGSGSGRRFIVRRPSQAPSAKRRAASSKLLSSALASPSTLHVPLLLLLYGSTKTVLHKILTLRIRRVVFTVTKHFICVQTVRPAYVIPQLALLSCFCVFVFIDFMAMLCLCIGVRVCVCV